MKNFYFTYSLDSFARLFNFLHDKIVGSHNNENWDNKAQNRIGSPVDLL